ncbi:MAG: hypothetical protein U1F17_01090 [Burkholderiaceae bacterium]
MKRVLKLLGAIAALAVVAAAATMLWAWKVYRRGAGASPRTAVDRPRAGRCATRRSAPASGSCACATAARIATAIRWRARVVDDPVVGKVYAPNLTPAGLGKWSDSEIAAAIRTGLRPDGRPLVIMPAHEYQHLAREDLAALIAYLRSLPAVERSTPPVEVGPLPRLLYALGKFPDAASGRDDRSVARVRREAVEAPTAAFGRYLASACALAATGASSRRADSRCPARIAAAARGSAWAPTGAEPRRIRPDDARRPLGHGHALRAPMPVSVYRKMDDIELAALWKSSCRRCTRVNTPQAEGARPAPAGTLDCPPLLTRRTAPRCSPETDSRQAWFRLWVSLRCRRSVAAEYVVVVVLPAVQADFGVARGGAIAAVHGDADRLRPGRHPDGRLTDRFGVAVPVTTGPCRWRSAALRRGVRAEA